MRRPFDDLQLEACAGGVARGDGALVAGIGEEAKRPGELPLHPSAGLGQAVTVLDVGRVHRQIEGQTDRVGDQMALASVDLFAGVIAAQPAGFRGPHALAVDHTSRWRGVLADLLTCLLQEDHPDPMPDAVLPETSKVVVDRALRRKVLRQHVPGTVGADEIEDRVQHGL